MGRGRTMSFSTKFLIGLTLAGTSTIIAWVLEVNRRGSTVIAPPHWSPNASWERRFPGIPSNASSKVVGLMGVCNVNGTEYCSNCAKQSKVDGIDVGIYMSDISMWWMVLPYFIVGCAEALINPLLQYYAYAFTPAPARALLQGICLVFTAMYPEALTAVFTLWLKAHVPNNLNDTFKFLGMNMGIDAFYLVGIMFLIPAVPLVTLVTRCAAPTALADDIPEGQHLREDELS